LCYPQNGLPTTLLAIKANKELGIIAELFVKRRGWNKKTPPYFSFYSWFI